MLWRERARLFFQAQKRSILASGLVQSPGRRVGWKPFCERFTLAFFAQCCHGARVQDPKWPKPEEALNSPLQQVGQPSSQEPLVVGVASLTAARWSNGVLRESRRRAAGES
jgi:isopenicillin N synthase-like dioxygenase